MSYDYDLTHENIMKSAKEQFKEKGFRDASIRKICKDAGVTNGAFYAHFTSKEDLFCSIVEPVVEKFSGLYSDVENEYLDINSADDVVNAFKNAYKSLESFIKFLSENREIILLILESAAGTAYENFPDKITEYEAESMKKFFKASERFIGNKENVSDNIIRMGASFLISTVFDGIKRNLNSEQILHETKLVSDYCAAGYKYVLGL